MNSGPAEAHSTSTHTRGQHVCPRWYQEVQHVTAMTWLADSYIAAQRRLYQTEHDGNINKETAVKNK
jgi:hypothetical protein